MNEINLSDMNWCKQKIDELQAENARLREELACTIDILEQTRLQLAAWKQTAEAQAAAPKPAQEGVPFKATVIFDDCTKIVEGIMPEQAEKQEPVNDEPVAFITTGFDDSETVCAKVMSNNRDGAVKNASEFAKHYPLVRTEPLYTRPQPDLTAEG